MIPSGPDARLPVNADRLKSIDALRGFDMFWIVGGAAVIHALDRVGGNALTSFFATQLPMCNGRGFAPTMSSTRCFFFSSVCRSSIRQTG